MKERPQWVYMEASEGKHSPIFTPDKTLRDGERFTLGNTTVECVHTPGHSPGVMSFFFQAQDGDKRWECGLLWRSRLQHPV